jgi:hypothetical protein
VGGVSGPLAKRDFDPTGLKRVIKFVLPTRLLNLINKRRYGCDQMEIEGIAEHIDRGSQAYELISDLRDGPPYSAKTTALMQREGYIQDLAWLFATYNADDGLVGGLHEARIPGARQVAKETSGLSD